MTSSAQLSSIRRRRGLLAVLCLAAGYASVVQSLGWAETSNFGLVRALSEGRADIDRWHWETKDKSWHDGHFHSVKAPGLAFVATPVYEGLAALGADELGSDAARTAREGGAGRWVRRGAPNGLYSDDPRRAERVRATIEESTPLVWMLGLAGVVLPALVLLLLVRSLVERVEPGYGAAAAVALGAGTLILPFSTLFFSHVLSATLAFAAFALLWRERGGAPRLALVAAAGLLAGFAIVSEYPLGLAALVLGAYAVARRPLLTRAAAYGAGLFAGVLPLLAYNVWAFGSPAHFSYEDAVAIQGDTGHDVVGLNESGFFGIELPDLQIAIDLLLASKGLLTLAPVLWLALAGLVLLWRSGRRAETYAIGGLLLAYLTYNSGYWLPFGGGSPGPRFLIPVLPFLAVPLALAWRRWPATALALAASSVVLMATATTTLPLIGNDDVGYWARIIDTARFEHTVLSMFGLDNGWLALSPFLIALAGAGLLAAAATGPVDWRRGERLAAAGVVVAWALLAILLPEYRGRDLGVGESHGVVPLFAAAGAAGLIALALSSLPLRRLRGARARAGTEPRRREPAASAAAP